MSGALKRSLHANAINKQIPTSHRTRIVRLKVLAGRGYRIIAVIARESEITAKRRRKIMVSRPSIYQRCHFFQAANLAEITASFPADYKRAGNLAL